MSLDDANKHQMKEIIRRKVSEFKKKHPQLSPKSLKKSILLEVKNNCFGNFTVIRRNTANLKINEQFLNDLCEEKPKNTLVQQIDESLKKTKNYRYSVTFLKNLRLRYQSIVDKLSKCTKQLHERNISLSEFNLKMSKFESLITSELKDELKQFVFETDVFFKPLSKDSSSHLLSSSMLSEHSHPKISKGQETLWDKIERRNKQAKGKVPCLPNSSKKKKYNYTSFSTVYKEYQKFIERKKNKLKGIKWLEEQIVVLKEKKLIFEGEAKQCYLSVIKNPSEFMRFGVLCMLEQMLFFNVRLESMRLPIYLEQPEKDFVFQYSKWSWEVTSIEINKNSDKKSKRLSTAQNDQFRSAQKYLKENLLYKSSLAFSKVRNKIANRKQLLIPLLNLNGDLAKMSDFDKLFVLGESLQVLKLKELNRLVEKYGPETLESKIFDKKFKQILESYFGSEETKNILRLCRAQFKD